MRYIYYLIFLLYNHLSTGQNDTLIINSEAISIRIDTTNLGFYEYSSDYDIAPEDLYDVKFIKQLRSYINLNNLYTKKITIASVVINNQSQYSRSLSLVSPEKYVTLYLMNPSGVSSFNPNVSFIKREGSKKLELFITPFKLDSNKSTRIFMKFEDFNRLIKTGSQMRLINTDVALSEALNENDIIIFNSNAYLPFFAGLFLWASLMILFIYFQDKSKAYLYFFLICFCYSIINLINLYSINLLFDNINNQLLLGLYCIFFFLWYYFIRNLFNTFKVAPKFDRFMKLLTWILFPIITLLAFCFAIGYSFFEWDLKLKDGFERTGMLILLIPFLIYEFLVIGLIIVSNSRIKSVNRNLVYFILPALIVVFILPTLYLVFKRESSISNEYDLISNIFMAVASVGLTLELFNRYNSQKHELLSNTLETQSLKLSKEKEINELIKNQNEKLENIVSIRTHELTKSIEDLKATQNKLIHSEKLAHLGQLTAGVAHEIQNPLNFINNFSDLNIELTKELETELTRENNKEELKAIADNIIGNSKKIKHHGMRADSIVKNMLQLSRANGGKLNPTDINALLDESWRLAYYGFRSKDKAFSVQVLFDLNLAIGLININSEDMGRAFVNLINNALYATHERWKQQESDPDYVPTIELGTNKLDLGCLIKIKDNGFGISNTIKDKIFNPFFTTKPTGHGVGLGLSLVYDIIVKGHNGKIEFQTTENEGTTFILEVPKT